MTMFADHQNKTISTDFIRVSRRCDVLAGVCRRQVVRAFYFATGISPPPNNSRSTHLLVTENLGDTL
jgi:hypothetical protein